MCITRLLIPIFSLVAAGAQVWAGPLVLPENSTHPLPLALPCLESGEHEIDGVTWQIAGTDSPRAIIFEGDPSEPIPVNSAHRQLHFLHTASAGSDAGIEKIEESKKIPAHPPQVFGYQLTYADGEQITLHMDWRHHIGPAQTQWEPVELYGSFPVALGCGFYLYHVVYPNPRPGQVIETLRVVPPEKGQDLATAYILGIATSEPNYVEIGERRWAAADYCALHGVSDLKWDSKAGSLGVPFHGKSDRGAFAYHPEPVTGDFTMQVQVTDLPLTAPWAFVSLTARETLLFAGRGGTNIAPGIFLKPAPEQDVEKTGIFYPTAGQPAKVEAVVADGKPSTKLEDADFDQQLPVWIRLQRQGNTFIGFHSQDGNSWVEAGRIDVPNCPPSLYPAIYTCLSHGPELLHAQFQGLEVRP